MKKITLFLFLMTFTLANSQSIPLDFESTTINYAFTDFDGGVATKISNPQVSGINTSATVMKMVKGSGAVWAGSKILMPSSIDFTTQKEFKVKVLSPVAGKRLNLKFEGPGTYFEKLSAPIKEANVWEELSFDFTGVTGVTNNAIWIVFMFDIGTQGDGSANSTYLFDDVTQGVLSTVNFFETSKIKIYPNSISNYLNIESNNTIGKVAIYNLLGQEVLVKKSDSKLIILETNTLQKGVYIVKVETEGKIITSKISKD